MQFGLCRQITSAHTTLSLYPLTTRHLVAPPSQSPLTMLLSLMLLAGLVGCGADSSDNSSNLGPHASVGEPPASMQRLSSGNQPINPVTSTVSPVPLSSETKTGAMAENRPVQAENNPRAVSSPSSQSVDSLAPLAAPAWIVKELASPDVGTRLRALETWVQSAPPGMVDRLILALEDKDERVRARAMELVEQAWAREAEAEK